MSDARPERVRGLAEEALTRADAARAGLEDLLAAVQRLRDELANGTRGHAPPDPATRAGATLDAARLAALEMAVAGRTRDEVERHLRVAYAGPDTAQVLDDVFGAEPEPRGASSL